MEKKRYYGMVYDCSDQFFTLTLVSVNFDVAL